MVFVFLIISVSIVPLRSIHVSNDKISFFYGQKVSHYIYHIYIVYIYIHHTVCTTFSLLMNI